MTLTVSSVVGTRRMRPKINSLRAPAPHGLELGSDLLVTPHRPPLVDGPLLVTPHRPPLVDGPLLAKAIGQLEAVARELTVVFPVHRRTGKPERKPDGLAVHS